ncbi:MAG: host attachment protein [Luteolibacter sp.]
MEKLIIVANLGRVRPIKFKPAGDDPIDQAHLVEVPGSTVEMRPQAIHEVVTDQAGRASQSGPSDRKCGMSYGEEHHLEAELETQALERIAEKIAEIVADEGHPAWRLVIPPEIAPRMIQALPPAVSQALSDVIYGDLTKLPLAELEKRFLSPH